MYTVILNVCSLNEMLTAWNYSVFVCTQKKSVLSGDVVCTMTLSHTQTFSLTFHTYTIKHTETLTFYTTLQNS